MTGGEPQTPRFVAFAELPDPAAASPWISMMKMPGWDVLTFIGTVILIVYAALSYHRPPRSKRQRAI
jgi:hypothetical protein